MKHFALRAACLLCAGTLALSMTGCGSSSQPASSTSEVQSYTASFGTAADFDYEAFTYSQDITADGYWEGVRALDYVTLPEDFASPQIARADVEPAESDVQEQIDAFLASAASTTQVTDRAAADGDTVNIDYVGSVDGVEFTGGAYSGYDLTLGSGSFIDGFEEQIAGHLPGETFDVAVTFPEGYRDSTDSEGNTVPLAGREAVFEVTLNYLVETSVPELTDAWVADYLGESDGLYTADELTDYFYNLLYTQNLSSSIYTYLMANTTFSDCPDVVLNYQVCECLSYYASMAQSYGTTLEDFVQTYAGYETVDALLADYEEDIYAYCQEALLYQAVAESLGIVATDELYAPYSPYLDVYGEEYLRMYALIEAVMDALCEGAQVV